MIKKITSKNTQPTLIQRNIKKKYNKNDKASKPH